MMAQAYLAEMYHGDRPSCDHAVGHGVRKDLDRTFELYTQAALQGHARSQFYLGIAYRDGEGCEQSQERAVEWFAEAAQQEYADAQCELGFAIYEGNGISQNKERALELWELSAAQGNTSAQYNVAWNQYDGRPIISSYAEARRLSRHGTLRRMVKGESVVRQVGGWVRRRAKAICNVH